MFVVFMVAGMSSRYGGDLKQFAKVGKNKETLIEISVQQALTAPFTKIIFITNTFTEHHFISLFSHNYKGIPVEYMCQPWDKDTRDRPWGTTGAVCTLTHKVHEPFILVNSDDLYGAKTFQQGYNLLKETGNNIIGGCKLERTMPGDPDILVNRGMIEVDNTTQMVTGLKECLKISVKNNPELLSGNASVNFIGLYPKTLDFLHAILDDFQVEHPDDRKIECLLPDNLNSLVKDKFISMHYFEISESVYGITYPGDELIVQRLLSLSL